MGPWISLFLLQDPFLQNQLGDPASSSPPSSSTCFAPCLHSSPKSWRAVEAIAPAASQSLPPRARTQPVALGLCLKIAQAPAICFCFSRQNTLCFRVSHNRIGCPPPGDSGRSFLLWFQLQIASPYMYFWELLRAPSRHMTDSPWNHPRFLTSPTMLVSCGWCGQTCPLCPCSELHLLWSRSCLTAWVLYYSWINTLCLPVGLISSGTNLTNTAVWFLSQRRFISGQFAVPIHLPPPYRYSTVLLWLDRIPCLLPSQRFLADYFHLIEKVATIRAWRVWPCTT